MILLIVCAGCGNIFENISSRSEIGTANVIKKEEVEETIEGYCYTMMVGDVPIPVCESDTYEQRYYVTLEYKGEQKVYDNKSLFDSDKKIYKVRYTEEYGVDSGKIYREYLEIIE